MAETINNVGTCSNNNNVLGGGGGLACSICKVAFGSVVGLLLSVTCWLPVAGAGRPWSGS